MHTRVKSACVFIGRKGSSLSFSLSFSLSRSLSLVLSLSLSLSLCMYVCMCNDIHVCLHVQGYVWFDTSASRALSLSLTTSLPSPSPTISPPPPLFHPSIPPPFSPTAPLPQPCTPSLSTDARAAKIAREAADRGRRIHPYAGAHSLTPLPAYMACFCQGVFAIYVPWRIHHEFGVFAMNLAYAMYVPWRIHHALGVSVMYLAYLPCCHPHPGVFAMYDCCGAGHTDVGESDLAYNAYTCIYLKHKTCNNMLDSWDSVQGGRVLLPVFAIGRAQVAGRGCGGGWR